MNSPAMDDGWPAQGEAEPAWVSRVLVPWFNERGAGAYTEVNYLDTSEGREKRLHRRLDLYLRMPSDWSGFREWPIIAVECKARCDTGDVRTGLRQTIGAMHGDTFTGIAADGSEVVLWRPAITLFCTDASWVTGRRLFSHSDALPCADDELPGAFEHGAISMIERGLWEAGCGILYGHGNSVKFVSNRRVAGGKTYQFPDWGGE